MAEPVTIARPYAEAVFKLACEQDRLAAWSDLLALLEAIVGDAQIQACISDPKVGKRQVEALVLGVAGERIDGAGRNFVQVLAQGGRLGLLPQIRALYEDARRSHEGILEARIVSALQLGDEQAAQLVKRLETKHRRKVSARIEIDPRLIGGVKIVVGDKVIDATVRGKLDAMAAALTH
jgi:F-type H+-transporting ATPase subunit delta